MGTLPGTCEIVEVDEELIANEKVRKYCMSRQGRVYSVEDDINQLFDSVNIKTSIKEKALRKNPMKQPMRPNSPQPYGIEMSETVSLKQALRGLCISQASEMAAMKKRSQKSSGSSRISEVEKMNRLHKTVVLEGKESCLSPSEAKRNILETMPVSTETPASSSSKQSHLNSTPLAQTPITKTEIERVPSKEKIVPLESDYVSKTFKAEQVQKRNLTVKESLHGVCTVKHVLEMDDLGMTKEDKDHIDMVNKGSCPSNGSTNGNVNMRSGSSCLMRPIFRNKNCVKRKAKAELDSAPRDSRIVNKPPSIIVGDTINDNSTTKHDSRNTQPTLGSSVLDIGVNNDCSSNTAKTDGRSRSKEKGEFSQSSKSSIGEYSTSTSEGSSGSGSSRCCNRPHMSKDMKWEAVKCVQKQEGFLSLRHFKLLKRLGSGDIGTVYLAELVGTNCMFALKVMDNDFLARRKKLTRAQTERETLQMLDHPFLPTLYAYFTTDKLSCLVMEYCPGGDLHVIRQKQPSRCFSEQAARYAFLFVSFGL